MIFFLFSVQFCKQEYNSVAKGKACDLKELYIISINGHDEKIRSISLGNLFRRVRALVVPSGGNSDSHNARI